MREKHDKLKELVQKTEEELAGLEVDEANPAQKLREATNSIKQLEDDIDTTR